MKLRARPGTCPAGSSNGSPSPGRWRWNTQVMFFDEATSALDPELVKGILALIADFQDRMG